MKVKEVIKLIEKDGWYFIRQRESHKVFEHPTKTGIVVIPDHGGNKDMAKETDNYILKQAGLK